MWIISTTLGCWVISSCFMPSPGMIREGQYGFLDCKNQTQEVVPTMCSDQLGLHMKAMLSGRATLYG